MPKITDIDAAGTSRTVEAQLGATVMETAIRNGVPGIDAECGGACACATCHLCRRGMAEATGEPAPMEEDMLDFASDVQPNSPPVLPDQGDAGAGRPWWCARRTIRGRGVLRRGILRGSSHAGRHVER